MSEYGFVEIIEQGKRMCDSFESCHMCLAYKARGNKAQNCKNFIWEFPEKFEKAVIQWVNKKPAQTNRAKFKEVYGIDPDPADGCPFFTGIECSRHDYCDTCKHIDFWEQEYKEPEN